MAIASPLCPVCHRKMHHDRTDISTGHHRARYNRVAFRCVQDDAWITVEIPVEDEE